MMKKLVMKAMVVLTAATMAFTGFAAAVKANDGMETAGYHRTCAINVTDTWEVRYVTGVNDFLNVRSDVSTNAPAIGALYNGQEVIVTGYVECGAVGNYSPFVRINFNGVEGYVDASFLGYYQETQPEVNPSVDPAPQQQEIDTVVYPRVDRHISNGYFETWCSLNTDGYYYNENGVRFVDNGNGTFSGVDGTVYHLI